MSAFTTDELETLGKLYQSVSCDETFLRQAVQQAGPNQKTLPTIVWHIKRLHDARNL